MFYLYFIHCDKMYNFKIGVNWILWIHPKNPENLLKSVVIVYYCNVPTRVVSRIVYWTRRVIVFSYLKTPARPGRPPSLSMRPCIAPKIFTFFFSSDYFITFMCTVYNSIITRGGSGSYMLYIIWFDLNVVQFRCRYKNKRVI